MLKGYPSPSRAVAIIAAVVLICLGGQLLYSRPAVPKWSVSPEEPVVEELVTAEDESKYLPCQKIPGAEDVVVIMRTGATEIEDKLPVHFDTTFRCYRDLIIFSDYAETFHEHEVHDVLANMDPRWTQSSQDFEIYLRLQQFGRDGLKPDELSGKASFEGSKSGKGDNPGWKLDKWKFLPMMNETLKLQPEKKWYVFLESDSYVVWSNLLQWLRQLDPSKPLYYGSENQIGDDVFAHGGSVFVMSKPAVQRGAEAYRDREDELHLFTDWHWAGDCILGKTLLESGVPLTWSWPMFQGGQPEKMDFTEKKGDKKKLWCAPALSYHHFSPSEMKRMWQFEQSWIRSRQKQAKEINRGSLWRDRSDILEHRRVFRELVLPNITSPSSEWNNLSPTLVADTGGQTFEGCQELCEGNRDCLQFSLINPSGCAMSTNEVMLGQRWRDYRSGWMMDRVEKWMKDLDKCSGTNGWTVT